MNNDFDTLQVYEHFDLLVIKKKCHVLLRQNDILPACRSNINICSSSLRFSENIFKYIKPSCLKSFNDLNRTSIYK